MRQGDKAILARHPDEENRVWAMLHTGSRAVGNKSGTYFIERAKREMERWHIAPYLPDENLAYLV